MTLIRNKVNSENIANEYALVAFKHLLDQGELIDESFKLGIDFGKIIDYDSFCKYYSFNLTSTEKVEQTI